MNMGSGSNLTKNVLISVSVQAVSLLISFIAGFIVPKFIDEYQYAYWQTFLLYVGYVGVLHFGLLDGIVLRYSQYDYDQLDKARIRSQFQVLLVSAACMAAAAAAAALCFFHGTSRTIILLVAAGIVTRNVATYNSYMFQITNRINFYARLILSQRLTYGALITLLLVLRVNRFECFCLADLTGDVIGMVMARRHNRGLYFGGSLSARETFREWKTNIASGIVLMVANWSGLLLVGSAKMVVQWRWDELSFGKASFAFSLSNLFLTFVTAVSVVLFPQLKRMDREKLPKVYGSIRGVISPLLFTVLIFYYPGCWVLERYLPAYRLSLGYLGILMPMIVYISKVNLLTNNYLKAYRRERDMLRVNVLTVCVGFGLFFVSAYVLNSMTAVLCCVVAVNMLKSILSEAVTGKVIGCRFTKEFVVEAVVTAAFILYTHLLGRWQACAAYGVTLLVYLAMQRRYLAELARALLVKARALRSKK